MSRFPPGLLYVVVAAVGALALGVGAVATLDATSSGIAARSSAALVLLGWSVRAIQTGGVGRADVRGVETASACLRARRSGPSGRARPRA